MNRFTIFKCLENSEKEFSSNTKYKGPLIVLVSANEPSVQLFFPLSKENAVLLKQILLGEKKFDVNSDVIGIYKTMLDSWRSSDKFLSGIIIDILTNNKTSEHEILVRLAIDDQNGNLDGLVRANFIHAIFLAALTSSDFVVSDEFLYTVMPEMFDDDEENENNDKKDNNVFPEDKGIINIVKDIMNGKIKDE